MELFQCVDELYKGNNYSQDKEHKEEIRQYMSEMGYDIGNIDTNYWSKEQLKVYLSAIELGYDISHLDPDYWTTAKMRLYLKSLKYDVNIEGIDPRDFNTKELEHHVEDLITCTC